MVDPCLETIADDAYAAIARVCPICCCSDEFYFFPQVISPEHDWHLWDDFSAASIEDLAGTLLDSEQSLSSLDSDVLSAEDIIDVELLQQVLRTLREQLAEVAPHRTQPTFHLTILAAGLADAMESTGPEAWAAREAGVPAFLQKAAECLQDVPELFMNLGLAMLADLQQWIESLRAEGFAIGDVASALQEFKAALRNVTLVKDCHLPEALLDKLVREHVGCGLGIDDLLKILHEELLLMEAVLEQEAARLVPGKQWMEVEQQIPFVAAGGGDLLALYRAELDSMAEHCRRHKLLPDNLPETNLNIAIVPAHLSSIRASDAYAAIPGSPPRGGTFFVMEQNHSRGDRFGRSLEYRMTASHEAWPGHHLLDSCRWALPRPLRRPLELPLFYEGWACLAEELMLRTGYFQGVWDRFILAKRRAERAARGLVDIGLQSGRITNDDALKLLIRVGYRPEVAAAVLPKYLLRPGYQVCYTLGLRECLNLLDRFGHNDVGYFARILLGNGEIGFARLEQVLTADMKRSQL